MVQEHLPLVRLIVVVNGAAALLCLAFLWDDLPIVELSVVAVLWVALAVSRWASTRTGIVFLSLPFHALMALSWAGVAEVDPCFDTGYSDDGNEWTWFPPRVACVLRADDGTASVVAESWWETSTFVCGVRVTALLVAPGRWRPRPVAAVGVCFATFAFQFG